MTEPFKEWWRKNSQGFYYGGTTDVDIAYSAWEAALRQPVVIKSVCQYEQDNTTAMNCKHCGKSKWLH